MHTKIESKKMEEDILCKSQPKEKLLCKYNLADKRHFKPKSIEINRDSL